MIHFVIIGADNLVVSAGRAWTLPAGALQVSNYAGSVQSLSKMMLTHEGLVDRPRSPGISTQGHQHTISDMPIGTVVSVLDVATGEQLGSFSTTEDAATETIDLPDAGVYDIVVEAPLPALPRTVRVTT